MLLLLLTTLLLSAGQTQEKLIDSLNARASTELRRPDTLAHYADKAYQLARTHKYPLGLATAAKYKGVAAYLVGDMDEALELHLESLALQQQLGDSLEIAKSNYNIAITYNAKADYDHTVRYALEAIRIFEQIGDLLGQGKVYNLLGMAAHRQGDMEKALEYLRTFNVLVTAANDPLEIGTSLSNLGATFSELNQNDSALHYLTRAVRTYEAMGGHRNLAGTYENISQLYETQGDMDEATAYSEAALDMSIRDGNKQREVSLLYNLGRLWRKRGNPSTARTYLERALPMAKEAGDKYIQYHIMEVLARIHADQGNHREAFRLLEESTLYKDSIFHVEKAKNTEELKTQYETEKKEQEIENLNQQNTIQELQLRQQNMYLLLAGALIIGLILMAWLLVRQRRLKDEAKLQRELNQKQEEATLGILHAEERERGRIAADLHDGVGQMLSAALLNLNQLNNQLEQGLTPSPNNMHNSLTLLENSYDEMRSISHQMMPNALLKAGLGYSIREFLSKVDQEHLKIHLDVVGLNDRLDEQTEISLYRCVQECVNNVIKHAHADRLSIQMVKDTEGISVTVEDNGRGFDQQKATYTEGIGLKNIRARIALLKGTIEVDSIPGKGTLILMYIPL